MALLEQITTGVRALRFQKPTPDPVLLSRATDQDTSLSDYSSTMRAVMLLTIIIIT